MAVRRGVAAALTGGRRHGAAIWRWITVALTLCLTATLACARIAAPPGGPPDRAPPQLLSTLPDSVAVLTEWDDDVEFQFSEVISEGGSPNFGLGSGDLEKLIILSPSNRVPVVRWRRNRITVHPREGWRPNTVYRVELLPGIVDLRNNRSRNGRVVTFTTGAPLPTDTLRGLVVNWENRRPAPRAMVEAILLPDSLPYRTAADSVGVFTLGPLPAGEYLIYVALDQNNDAKRQPREPFDTVRLQRGQVMAGEMWAFRRDTTPVRIQSVTRGDSLSLVVTFSQQLDPYQALRTDSVRVVTLPDSVPVAVDTVIPQALFDSLFGRRFVADTGAPGDTTRIRRERARADSIRIADSVARVRREQALGAARRPDAPRVDTLALRERRTRPALFDKLVIRLEQPLVPEMRYVVTFFGLRNASRIAGSPKSGAIRIEPRPVADTSRAVRDTARAIRDTARGRPDTVPR
jgi:hypothetical protein